MTTSRQNTGNIEAIYRLSPTQEGILFHTLYAPDSDVYFEQYVCTLQGVLDVEAFTEAWRRVVARHAMLRTFFTWKKGESPLQIVRQTVETPWKQLDWRERSGVEREHALTRELEKDRMRHFNLEKAPLIRLALLRFTDDEYRFVWSFHHLLLDGWSMRLVLTEVLALYESLRDPARQPPTLPPPRSFRNYIAWLQKQPTQQAEEFWRAQLKGFTTTTRLPLYDPAAHSLDGGSGSSVETAISLSAQASEQLGSFARAHRLTLNTLVQGAWALLLHQYGGGDDVVFGVTVSNRPAGLEGAQEIVGLMINTLPARARVDTEETVAAWLESLQAAQVQSRQFDQTALVDVQRWSDVPAGESLFDSLVVFENHPLEVSRDQVSSLSVREPQYMEHSNYPLALLVVPGERIKLSVIYDSDHFATQAGERVLSHLRMLLEDIAANPARTLSALPTLTTQERQQVLEYGQGPTLADAQPLLLERIAAQVEAQPDAVAIEDGKRRLSYAELDRRSDRVAAALRKRGVGRGDCVPVFMSRGCDQYVSLLGVLKACSAYVPIDPVYPAARVRQILLDLASRSDGELCVLTRSGDVETLADGDWNTLCLDRLPEHEGAVTTGHPRTEDLAYVIYTSGSTGTPKGVMITHANLADSTAARLEFYQQPVQRFLLMSSFAFDSSVAGIYWTLACGGTLLLPPGRDDMAPREIARTIERHAVTHTLMLPGLFELVLKAGSVSQLQSLRTVIVAGETCPAMLARRHFDTLPQTALYNEYGPTEGTVWATVHACSGKERVVPIGRPIPGMQVFVLDRRREPVPIGAPGQLYLAGPGVSPGYVNQGERSNESFSVLPSSQPGGIRAYATGDLVRYRDDGALEFLGRVDQQVKIRGYRVELGDIEAVLKEDPSVAEAAVVAVATPADSLMDSAQLINALEKLPAADAEALLAECERIGGATPTRRRVS